MTSKKDKRALGARVRSLREGRMMTRVELAVKAGVSHGTIVAIEQGTAAYNHRPKTIAAILSALGEER